MINDEEGSDDEEMQSAVLEKRKVMKPKGFDLIESDIGEDIVQYLKQKKADEDAASFFAQVHFCLCFCFCNLLFSSLHWSFFLTQKTDKVNDLALKNGIKN